MALINWRKSTTGDWSLAADWSSNTVPRTADDVSLRVTWY